MDCPPHERPKVIHKNFIIFGKIYIHEKKLKQNKLFTRYPAGGGTTLGKTRIISEFFSQLIINILTLHNLDTDLQARLSPIETQLLTDIMRISRLGKALGYKQYVRSVDDLVSRYRVLRGALDAGLRATETIDELRVLTTHLASPIINKIKQKDAVWIHILLDDLANGL